MNKSFQEFVSESTNRRMIGRPEYYTGRGNNEGDLNAGLLQRIYDGAKAEGGPKAAQNFVRMVSRMRDDASAITFLIALKRLRDNGWVLRAGTVPASHTESFTEAVADVARARGGQAASQVFAIGLASMNFSKAGSTQEKDGGVSIILPFLKKHQAELDDEGAWIKGFKRGDVMELRP